MKTGECRLAGSGTTQVRERATVVAGAPELIIAPSERLYDHNRGFLLTGGDGDQDLALTIARRVGTAWRVTPAVSERELSKRCVQRLARYPVLSRQASLLLPGLGPPANLLHLFYRQRWLPTLVDPGLLC
jgi:hypothetical protein